MLISARGREVKGMACKQDVTPQYPDDIEELVSELREMCEHAGFYQKIYDIVTEAYLDHRQERS